MKLNENGEVFEEAVIETLRSLYDVTKENPNFYYRADVISSGTKKRKVYGRINSMDVPSLLESLVEEGLVNMVIIANSPEPIYGADKKEGYRANLEKEEEIQTRISK